MVYWFVILLSRLVCMMPFGMRRMFAHGLGLLCWALVPKRRRELAINNIIKSLTVDREEASAIAKASVIRFGRMIMEVLYFPRITRDTVGQISHFSGREHLEKALSCGRGVILATAHSGNWELLGHILALTGFPIVGVAQKQTNEDLNRFINEYRSMSGMHITYKTGVREMIRLLNEGKIIGLLMDQDSDDDGIFVEFFGRPASTAPGAAALARLREAPIVPVFITENGDGTHTVIVRPMIWVERTAQREQDLKVTTQILTSVIEQHIREYPTDWFWLHNRWKHQPQL